jgi:hypothetical protein
VAAAYVSGSPTLPCRLRAHRRGRAPGGRADAAAARASRAGGRDNQRRGRRSALRRPAPGTPVVTAAVCRRTCGITSREASCDTGPVRRGRGNLRWRRSAGQRPCRPLAARCPISSHAPPSGGTATRRKAEPPCAVGAKRGRCRGAAADFTIAYQPLAALLLAHASRRSDMRAEPSDRALAQACPGRCEAFHARQSVC